MLTILSLYSMVDFKFKVDVHIFRHRIFNNLSLIIKYLSPRIKDEIF